MEKITGSGINTAWLIILREKQALTVCVEITEKFRSAEIHL